MHRIADLVFSLLVAAFFAGILFGGFTYDGRSRAFPVAIAAPMLVLSMYQLTRLGVEWSRHRPEPAATGPLPEETEGIQRIEALARTGRAEVDEALTRKRVVNIVIWMAVSFVLLWLIGFREGLPIFVFLYLWRESKDSLIFSAAFGIATWLALYFFFGHFLHYPWAAPEISLLFGFDWPGIQ